MTNILHNNNSKINCTIFRFKQHKFSLNAEKLLNSLDVLQKINKFQKQCVKIINQNIEDWFQISKYVGTVYHDLDLYFIKNSNRLIIIKVKTRRLKFIKKIIQIVKILYRILQIPYYATKILSKKHCNVIMANNYFQPCISQLENLSQDYSLALDLGLQIQKEFEKRIDKNLLLKAAQYLINSKIKINQQERQRICMIIDKILQNNLSSISQEQQFNSSSSKKEWKLTLKKRWKLKLKTMFNKIFKNIQLKKSNITKLTNISYQTVKQKMLQHEKGKKLSLLYMVQQCILAISTISINPQRCFSKVKNLISKRRTNLSDQTIDSIIFLRQLE